MKKRLSVLLCAVLIFGTTLGLMTPAKAEEALTPVVQSVTETGVEAEAVMAAGEGYGTLIVGETRDEDGNLLTPPRTALMGPGGFLVMPYTESWHYWFVSDGVISLASNLYRSYLEGEGVEFYLLADRPTLIGSYDFATAMVDGAALTFSGELEEGTLELTVIDRTGGRTYTFPSAYGSVNGLGGDETFTGIGCERTAGWPGQGLIAVGHGVADGDGPYIHWSDGYLDTAGAQVINLPAETYSDAFPFAEGYARVLKNGRYGFIDRTGREVIPCVYTAVCDFSDGLAGVVQDGKAGYIDPAGKTVVPFDYDDVYGAGSGVCAVVKDGKCGLVDYSGNVVLPLEYDDITPCLNGVAYALKAGEVYVVEIADELMEKPAYWAEREVAEAIAAGLVPAELRHGYGEEISRAAVAQLFYNLTEQCAGKTMDALLSERGLAIDPNAFTDTSDPAVLAMNALGIINGTGGGRFSPEGNLTRAQTAAILCRIARVLGVETEGYTHDFVDVAGHWVEPELGWPVHAGVTNGVGGGRFDPDGTLTLQQAILLAERTRKYLTEK